MGLCVKADKGQTMCGLKVASWFMGTIKLCKIITLAQWVSYESLLNAKRKMEHSMDFPTQKKNAKKYMENSHIIVSK